MLFNTRIKIDGKYFVEYIYKENNTSGRYGGHLCEGEVISYDDIIGIKVDSIGETFSRRSIGNVVKMILNLMSYEVIELQNIELEVNKGWLNIL